MPLWWKVLVTVVTGITELTFMGPVAYQAMVQAPSICQVSYPHP